MPRRSNFRILLAVTNIVRYNFSTSEDNQSAGPTAIGSAEGTRQEARSKIIMIQSSFDSLIRCFQIFFCISLHTFAINLTYKDLVSLAELRSRSLLATA